MARWSRRASAVAFAVILAACGGGAGEAGAGSDSAVGSGASSPEQPSGDGETLAEFFGYDADPAESEAAYREDQAKIQELIRSCMAEEGFEYIPVTEPQDAYAFASDDQAEFVAEQGFGISTWYGNEEAFADPAADVIVDPNQELIDAMTESEQEAYFAALHGTPEEQAAMEETVIDEETGEEYLEMTGPRPGCYGEADSQVYGEPSQDEDLYLELEPIYEELSSRIEADPRVVEANQQWASCMAEAGFDYDNRDAFYETVFQELQGRFDEIVGPNGGYVDPLEGMSEAEVEAFFEEKSQAEIDAFFAEAQADSRQDIDEEALAALQQEERDTAVAEFECSQSMDEVYQDVSAQIEPEILKENRALFEQVRDAEQN